MSDNFFQLSNADFGFDSNQSNEDFDDLTELIMPDIRPKKSNTLKPVIVVIDDDYSTLDLMKSYLQRNFEYVSFDGPKEAIFYLNRNVPDLIFLDCYINMINSKRVIEIIKSYKELENVPIVFLLEPDEKGAVLAKLPAGVVDCIVRPVARGELQRILDRIFQNKESDTTEGNSLT